MAAVNYDEEMLRRASYGIVRGIGRSFARLGYGIYEIATFPFPDRQRPYRPPYRSDIRGSTRDIRNFRRSSGFRNSLQLRARVSARSLVKSPQGLRRR